MHSLIRQRDGHTTTVVLTKSHKTACHNRENRNLGKLTNNGEHSSRGVMREAESDGCQYEEEQAQQDPPGVSRGKTCDITITFPV